MAQQQSNLQAAFTAYTNLTAIDRTQFKTMLSGYEFKAQAASNAGKKAAESKRKTAVSGSPATGAA